MSGPIPVALPPLSSPHSASFVDLNGDCHADLFLTTGGMDNVTFEVWLWQKDSNTYVQSVSVGAPRGAGQASFADFDRDGAIDLLFPVCYPKSSCEQVNELWIVYVTQRPVCENSVVSGSNCQSTTDMCKAKTFVFPNITGINTTQSKDVVRVPSTAFPNKFFTLPNIPLSVHVGDYDIDGFPDILVAVENKQAGTQRVELWNSDACTEAACGAAAKSSKRRTFTAPETSSHLSALTSIDGAYAAAFFDLGDSGNLDTIVLYHNGSLGVRAVYNNLHPDALFVKALGLNGVCDSWCKSDPKFPDPKPYGVNFPGGVFKLSLNDFSGKGLGVHGVQLYQSAYLPLLTPYVYFGLGRVSNYIQSVFYGVTLSNDDQWFNYWLSVVPNSQVVCIPYPTDDHLKWKLELFLSPSGIMFWILIAIFTCLLGLGIAIGIMKWQEKKKDKQHDQVIF
eukprot:TRINITY_DN2335_c0_g1_i3.p1 TRINITY_DN2335_c0_g1~~TRINITY_DN2335_c0_g1_i3.p1  ORF type:complete len:450 (-),score=94.04 TRINITY_DN2335_c0_g1_i3:54-1403(-)